MASPSPVPTAAEVLAHPAFPSAVWRLKPDQSGLAPVAEGRGGPFNISYEIHGNGPIKLLFIMGLGGLKTAWQRQTLHFGHENRDKYSVLVLDNRGMGNSDKPLMRYSSSEMALDLIDLLTHISWLPPSSPSPSSTPERTLHIVGISLGGMIAQELACRIPQHISSLSLICTAPYIQNTTTFAENMANRISMLVPKSLDRSIRDAGLSMFPASYLAAPDNAHLPSPETTPNCAPPTGHSACAHPPGKEYGRFPTNGHRFVAQEMHKRLDPQHFGVKGFLLQLIAAGWHYKSREQLEEMAEKVGRERILVMHGTEDRMISMPHGEKLFEYVKPGKALAVEGMGHAPLVERCEWFNETVGEMFGIGEKLDGRV
ncbi:Alpha/Beta hydrolase protein [Podospora aff. communis PSN243]|uniref:Alpha/Beta hydrolase protein n=1 Tax=Podospora aff. communis PSN243 TaxID=3040156 RepID=A0AAV9GEB4_9PEZI|nr:Alpha/Beta hydrolase protein [Podospora aff. communis PSN243]